MARITLILLLLLPAAALAADVTPFFRIGPPNIFVVGPSATQYAIAKPREATSYRFVNRCNVDVRILKVDSLSQEVTLETGTVFLARSVETIATTNPKFVSLITMEDPGEKICRVELQYGTGN